VHYQNETVLNLNNDALTKLTHFYFSLQVFSSRTLPTVLQVPKLQSENPGLTNNHRPNSCHRAIDEKKLRVSFFKFLGNQGELERTETTKNFC